MSKWDADNLNAPHSQRHLDEIPQRTAPTIEQMEASVLARAMATTAETAALAVPAGDPVTLTYRNWRGEVAERTIIPRRLRFGWTDWHPDPQWLLTAWDVEKAAERDFALKDFGHPAVGNHTPPEAVNKTISLLAEWLDVAGEGDPMIDVLLGVIREAHAALDGGKA